MSRFVDARAPGALIPWRTRMARCGIPHTDVADWVSLAQVSPGAVYLYVLLRIHAEEGVPVDAADIAAMTPSRGADEVDQWCRELVSLGAISVLRRVSGQLDYMIHSVPPNDYAGPVTLTEHRDGFTGPPPQDHPPQTAAIPHPRRPSALRVALYRHYDKAGVLLYVGITKDLEARFGGHGNTATWWPFAHSASVEWHPDRATALRAEREAITLELPLFNVDLAPLGTAERAVEYLRQQAGVSA